jgi:5'-3' exonuclease
MKTAIIDLSSMFHRWWHIDPENTTHKIVSFLKTLQFDKVIIAVDCPPYKRKEVFPQYKSNRDVPAPELIACLKATEKRVFNEGFTIAQAQGWEADDVIATIIDKMVDKGEYVPEDVVVYGSDKDLLQMTKITDPFTGECKGSQERLGVKQEQVVGYLALIGDTSDNIPGVPGIGPKTAQNLLSSFETVGGIYDAIEKTPEKFTRPAVLNALVAAKETIQISVDLVRLNCNAPVEYFEGEATEIVMDEIVISEQVETQTAQQSRSVSIVTEPVEYCKSLEPVDFKQAWQAATVFNKSGLYPKFKGPEQMIMIIMRGRELGIGATTALDIIDMIQGKPTMKAAGMLALVMQHRDVCEYIYCSEIDDEKSTWITKRVNIPTVISRTFTIKDAESMGLTGKDNWKKQQAVMLQWRACSQLIRQVYPDLINGLYAREEMEV